MADAFAKLKQIPEHLVETARARQSELAGGNVNLHLSHAEAVADLTDEIRACNLPIKRSFAALGLDYTLARHAIWIAETLADLGPTFPGLDTLGPSLVLFVREASRRLQKEGRPEQLAPLVAELMTGAPRDTVREKFLPAREPAALARVLAALRRHDPLAAHAAFSECDDDDRAELRVFAATLSRIVAETTESTGAFASIETALGAATRLISTGTAAAGDSESP